MEDSKLAQLQDPELDQETAQVVGSYMRKRFKRYRSTFTRTSSGAELYRNKVGRCEDAPCCGCCNS